MATTTIRVYRGDDRTIKVTVNDQDGAVVDITGARMRFTASTSPTVITKDSSAGVTEVDLTDPTNGIFEIYIVPADTSSNDVGNYLFDIEMQLGGKTYTLDKGYLRIEADVTT